MIISITEIKNSDISSDQLLDHCNNYLKKRIMKIIYSIAILIACASAPLLAQDHVFGDYGFDDSKIEVPSEFSDKEEVTLFLKRKIDIVTDEKSVLMKQSSGIIESTSKRVKQTNSCSIGIE